MVSALGQQLRVPARQLLRPVPRDLLRREVPCEAQVPAGGAAPLEPQVEDDRAVRVDESGHAGISDLPSQPGGFVKAEIALERPPSQGNGNDRIHGVGRGEDDRTADIGLPDPVQDQLPGPDEQGGCARMRIRRGIRGAGGQGQEDEGATQQSQLGGETRGRLLMAHAVVSAHPSRNDGYARAQKT